MQTTQWDGQLALASEDNGSGGVNYYYSLTNRKYGWASPYQNVITDCIEKGSVYKLSVDLRVHATEKKKY